MSDTLKAFFDSSILSAQVKLDESSKLQAYLDGFTSTMGESLSAAVGMPVKVDDSRSALLAALSQKRTRSLISIATGQPRAICEPIEPHHYNLSVGGGRGSRELFSYEPDPVGYFPVRIQYGDGAKELICGNAKEVKSGMRTMAKETLPAILRYLQNVKRSNVARPKKI